MTQLALDTWAAEPPKPPTMRETWERFHAENPHVYRLFERFAFEAIGAGRERFGAKAIWERLRWELGVRVVGAEAPKLNNNHTAYYAREFVRRNPKHAGLFEFRGGGACP